MASFVTVSNRAGCGNTINSGGDGNVYDFENHMVQHGLVTIVYDGDGNRVIETGQGKTTNYLVDTLNPTGYAQVVDELQSAAVVRSYTWGSQLISQKQGAGGQQLSFYGFDGHGSVRSLTDNTGATTDTYDYDAFGNLLNSTGTTPNSYLFAGESYDSALGVYYNRARYYEPMNGRFLTMDTDEGDDERPTSLHKYMYGEANPIDNLDPSGNDIADIGALSIGVTLDAMPQLQIATVLKSIKMTFQGVQACYRPLAGKKKFPGTLENPVEKIFRHTYIKILDPDGEYGVNKFGYHTYGIIGQNHTEHDQEVQKDQFGDDQNKGAPPDHCIACIASPQQRAALVAALEYWSSGQTWMFDVATKHRLKSLRSSVPVLGWAESN